MWIVQTKIAWWIFCNLFSIVCSKLATQWQAHTKRRHSNYLHIPFQLNLQYIFFLSKVLCVLMGSVTVQPKITSICPMCITQGYHPASLHPPGGRSWFVYEGRSRSLVPRFTACPEQMGDSGNWHEGLLACWDSALSLSLQRYCISTFPLAGCCWVSTNAKLEKTNPPHSSLSGKRAGQVMVCQDVKDSSKLFCQSGKKTSGAVCQ